MIIELLLSLLYGIMLLTGFFLYRNLKKEIKFLNSQIDKLHQHYRAMMDTDVLIGKRFSKFQHSLQDFECELTAFKTQVQSNHAYKQAIKMVEMGASITDLTNTCSISEAEAKLLVHLHGYKLASNGLNK
jgi:hypothetical protein